MQSLRPSTVLFKSIMTVLSHFGVKLDATKVRDNSPTVTPEINE
jgi:hypothetical protein